MADGLVDRIGLRVAQFRVRLAIAEEADDAMLPSFVDRDGAAERSDSLSLEAIIQVHHEGMISNKRCGECEEINL